VNDFVRIIVYSNCFEIMKIVLLCIICACTYCACGPNTHDKPRALVKDSVQMLTPKIVVEFRYYFKILDSAANTVSGDTIECCHNATWFMEENTKIESEGDKGYAGNESFTQRDLRRWHHWFDSTVKRNAGNKDLGQ